MADPTGYQSATEFMSKLLADYGPMGAVCVFLFNYLKTEITSIHTKLDSLIVLSNKSFGAMVAISKGKVNGNNMGGD